jgi:hypothetical protein
VASTIHQSLVFGDYADYVKNTWLPLNAVVLIIVSIADVLVFALIVYIIAQNYLKVQISESNISKLEVESQNLRLLIDTADAVGHGRLCLQRQCPQLSPLYLELNGIT